ncbi:hypothetical protein [Halorarum salinum]|uniref:Uncharacterized protein n=1 Tax=Halorarum salinum TaxID=2743089 RepID=A0A7D5QCV9_9EURY|nr:hypothetical protein [Halobaculum salinum]QLG62860.1 hypothetical protein HUG12_14435 [Halobaculum salinum]
MSTSSAFKQVGDHTLQHLYQRLTPEWDCIDCPERHENPEDFEDVGCSA